MKTFAKPTKVFLTQSLSTSFSNLSSPAAHLCSQADLRSVYTCFQQNTPDCVELASLYAGLLSCEPEVGSPQSSVSGIIRVSDLLLEPRMLLVLLSFRKLQGF